MRRAGGRVQRERITTPSVSAADAQRSQCGLQGRLRSCAPLPGLPARRSFGRQGRRRLGGYAAGQRHPLGEPPGGGSGSLGRRSDAGGALRTVRGGSRGCDFSADAPRRRSGKAHAREGGRGPRLVALADGARDDIRRFEARRGTRGEAQRPATGLPVSRERVEGVNRDAAGRYRRLHGQRHPGGVPLKRKAGAIAGWPIGQAAIVISLERRYGRRGARGADAARVTP